MLVGARAIPLTEPVQWEAGQKFVLTTTTWKDEFVNQNEVLTVSSVTDGGFTLNTVEALQYNHYGERVGLVLFCVLALFVVAGVADGLMASRGKHMHASLG